MKPETSKEYKAWIKARTARRKAEDKFAAAKAILADAKAEEKKAEDAFKRLRGLP